MIEYEQRDVILRQMGYSCYQEYLRSSLWRSIRQKAMVACNGECVLCRHPAKEVHHTNYSEASLRGQSIESLVPLCETCHDLGEFSTAGAKRTLPEANARLRLLSSNQPIAPLLQTKRRKCKECKSEIESGRLCPDCRLRRQSIHSPEKASKTTARQCKHCMNAAKPGRVLCLTCIRERK